VDPCKNQAAKRRDFAARKREIVGAFHWYEKGYIWLPKKNLSKKARELAMVGTERKWEKVEVFILNLVFLFY